MRRVRIEALLAAIFLLLAVLTAIFPTWVESLLGISPDSGSGELEWLATAAVGTAAVVLGLDAFRLNRKMPVVPQGSP